jgi:hypothetical protein
VLRLRLLLCGGLLGLCAAQAASAATIMVEMTGKLTAVNDANQVTDGSLGITTPYTATMTYDLAGATDRDPDPTFGDYAIPAGFSSFLVSVGSYSFSSNGFLVLGVLDGNVSPTEDSLNWFTDQMVSSGPLVPGVTWASFAWSDGTLVDGTGTALSSDSLASANWNRAAYGPDNFAFYLFAEVLDPSTTGRDYVEIQGTIESIAVSVPEPADVALLGAAGLMLAAVRRRR